jgi:hypothetical protein
MGVARWTGFGGACAILAALAVVADVDGRDEALAAPGAPCAVARATARETAGDFSEFGNINIAMNKAIVAGNARDQAGYASALTDLASLPASNRCAEIAKRASIALADATVAATACKDIVNSDPSIGGVNAFLVCITPVNAGAIAAGRIVRDASNTFTAGQDCTDAAPTPSFSSSAGGPFSQYARSMTLAAAAFSFASAASEAVSIPRAVAGAEGGAIRSYAPTLRCLDKSCEPFRWDFGRGSFAEFTGDSGVGYLGFGTGRTGPPRTGDIAKQIVERSAPGAPPFQMSPKLIHDAQQMILRTAKRSHERTASSEAARAPGPQRVLVVTSRRSGLAIVPTWLRVAGSQLAVTRAAEAAAAARLGGDRSAPLPAPPPAPMALTRAMGLAPRGAAALNAVLQNQYARAVAALDAARAYEALGWLPANPLNPGTRTVQATERQTLHQRAAELAALAAQSGTLARRADLALRPGPGARVVAIVSGPRVLRLPDVGTLLRAGAPAGAASGYATLAAETA